MERSLLRRESKEDVLCLRTIPASPGYLARSVPFATYELPTGFFIFSEKGQPYVPVKSVLAVVFLWQRGKVIWRAVLTTEFATIPCHLVRTLAELKTEITVLVVRDEIWPNET